MLSVRNTSLKKLELKKNCNDFKKKYKKNLNKI